MATMNMNTRQSFVYPHFHDTQSKRQSSKDIEIDNSVYHLLSLYLNTDTLPPTTYTKKHSTSATSPQLPYWRNTSTKSNHHRTTSTTFKTQHRNWFGEQEYNNNNNNQQRLEQEKDLLLLSNTRKNSNIEPLNNYNEDCITLKNNKKKSVSFNENVIIICISNDTKSTIQLNSEEDDEPIFVDALEYIS